MSNAQRRRTYYEILGVPVGASIDHIKASYRLLSTKTLITDLAYKTLVSPEERQAYHAELIEESQWNLQPSIQSAGDYVRLTSKVTSTNRNHAVTVLSGHGFRDCTSQVENTPSWSAFVETFGSGTERYFFSEDNEYLVVVDFSPFVLSGEGWHMLGWWLHKSCESGWELIGDGELDDGSLGEILKSLALAAEKRGPRETIEQSGAATWADWGAPSEMPHKPELPTHTELHYISGIEKLLSSGVMLDRVLDAVSDCTPEQLVESYGIFVETQSDVEFLLKYAEWLRDLTEWYKGLPSRLATMVADGLGAIKEGRYSFLASRLRREP